MEFQRETATRVEDMPHQFKGIQRADPCEVCMADHEDVRHKAWEQQAVASREHANAQTFDREIGS